MTYKYELHRVVLREDGPDFSVLTAKHAKDYALTYCYEPEQMWKEFVYMIMLNRGHKVLGHHKLSEGGTAIVSIDKKEVAKLALDTMADAVILVHNHPAGKCTPSQADIRATDGLRRALATLDIQLLDHIVLGEGEYFSFNEEKTAKV